MKPCSNQIWHQENHKSANGISHPNRLKLGAWNFSGAWMLELGALL
jgi:hypothetical protein